MSEDDGSPGGASLSGADSTAGQRARSQTKARSNAMKSRRRRCGIGVLAVHLEPKQHAQASLHGSSEAGGFPAVVVIRFGPEVLVVCSEASDVGPDEGNTLRHRLQS